MCYLHETTTKIKACHEHRKTHDLINKKGLFDRERLVKFWAKLQTKTGTGWNKKIKKFCRHDQTEVVIFGQRKNMLHSATAVQFPFSQPSHWSFYRNVGLCWGSWPCLPLISSGWVVVGFWTKMIGRLEGTFPDFFFSICSSKLEASHTCLQRLQLFLNIDVFAPSWVLFITSTLLHLGEDINLLVMSSFWRRCRGGKFLYKL